MAEAAGSVKIILAVDSTSYSAALEKAKSQLKQLETGAHSAAGATRKDMTEARGAIALLGEEIGVRLPRHVRSFVAELPGVAAAMSAAFSTVAIVGLGLAIFEAGKKVYEFIEKNREAAEKNAEAWEKSRDAVRLSNLELDASTIHLQNELAKLEHKPENKLAEELARAAVEASKLDQQLVRASDDARKLLADQAPGWIAQTFLHTGGTAYEQSLAKDHSKALAEAKTMQDQLNVSTEYGNSLLTRRNELEAAQAGKSTYQDAAGKTQQLVKSRFAFAPSLKNEIDATEELQKNQRLESANIQAQMGEDAARAAVDKEQGRKDALDAQKQAAEKQMQEWRRELEAVKAVTDFSVQQEAVYWQALADSVKHNSPLLIAATEEANKAAAAANKKYQADLLSGWIEGNREFEQQKADDLRISDAIMTGLRESQREIDQSTKEHEQAARANFENTAAEIEAAQKIGEESIKLQEQRGQLSHLAAAIAVQQLHAAGAEEWRQAFGTAQNAGANFSLAFAEKHGAGVERQGEADTATKEAATALGALKDSAGELTAQFIDIPAHVKEALDSTVNTVNGALLRTLTDPYHRGQWKDAGKQIFSGLAGSGLKLAEGAVGKLIPGLGKRGESPSAPLYTKDVQGAGAAVASTAGALGQLFTSKGGSAAGQAVGSFGSKLLSSLLHFEAGGSIPSGMPAVVGESGPELFVPSSSGRIISNRTLNTTGGSVSHVINVDARGAGDPAAVEAAVHRTMGAYMAQLPAMTVETMRNYNARRPSGARV
jgi:hypothetical protein